MGLFSIPKATGSRLGIGPGVYDVHSPHMSATDEIRNRLRRAHGHIPAPRLWVNPHWGLKTRIEDEATQTLRTMVAAVHVLRVEFRATVGSETDGRGRADELAGRA